VPGVGLVPDPEAEAVHPSQSPNFGVGTSENTDGESLPESELELAWDEKARLFSPMLDSG
jgi:hypothetical protein